MLIADMEVPNDDAHGLYSRLCPDYPLLKFAVPCLVLLRPLRTVDSRNALRVHDWTCCRYHFSLRQGCLSKAGSIPVASKPPFPLDCIANVSRDPLLNGDMRFVRPS